MILGLNTNHDFRGKVFHVQTEDSGIDNPVLVTHCFIGGTIIASRKTNYEDALERDDLEAHIKSLARAQHKEMVKELMSGAFQKAAQLAGRGKASRKDIPLARDSKGSKRPPPIRKPSSRPSVKPPPPRPTEPDPIDAEVLESMDVQLIDEAGETMLGSGGPVEFSSHLLRVEPLDPVLLAYLLEDDQAGPRG